MLDNALLHKEASRLRQVLIHSADRFIIGSVYLLDSAPARLVGRLCNDGFKAGHEFFKVAFRGFLQVYPPSAEIFSEQAVEIDFVVQQVIVCGIVALFDYGIVYPAGDIGFSLLSVERPPLVQAVIAVACAVAESAPDDITEKKRAVLSGYSVYFVHRCKQIFEIHALYTAHDISET